MMDHTKMRMAYQTTMTSHSNAYISRRRSNHRLLALAKLAALTCFMVASMVMVYGRWNSFYAAHISGWHQVTVVQGDTVYGFAMASGAGYIPAVEQAIDQKNGLHSTLIVSGQTLLVPNQK